jgi:hypothetical protein
VIHHEQPFSSPELALSTSLQLAKFVSLTSNSSTGLIESDVECVANTSVGDLAIASHDLSKAWIIVVNGDYVLDDIASSLIMDICALTYLLGLLANVSIVNSFILTTPSPAVFPRLSSPTTSTRRKFSES